MPETEYHNVSTPGTYPSDMSGETIASATTIAPVKYLTPISGAVEITTITVPWVGFVGSIVLIPISASAFTLATGGNIAKAASAVQYRAMKLTYVEGLWYPEYVS
jgi:hypothetical protein